MVGGFVVVAATSRLPAVLVLTGIHLDDSLIEGIFPECVLRRWGLEGT